MKRSAKRAAPVRALPCIAASPEDVAKMVDLRHQEILDAINAGELRAYRITGVRQRVLVEDVAAWLRKAYPEVAHESH
jgi:hypothetical protein